MRPSSLLRMGMFFLLLVAVSSVAQQQPAANGPQNGIQASDMQKGAMPANPQSGIQNGAESTLTSSDQPSGTVPASGQMSSNGQQNSAQQLQARDPRYRINKTDQISVNFLFTPEYDQQVTVQPDGYVTMRGIGDVKVEGKTVPEAVEEMQAAYGKILHDPVITLLLTNVVPAYFIAGGEVKNPGRYNFAGDTTVTQAVTIAGGFTSYAKHSQVILFRRINNEWVEGRRIDVKHMINTANLAEDLHLQAGDMLYVPKNFISKTTPWLTPFSDFIKFGFFGNYPVVF